MTLVWCELKSLWRSRQLVLLLFFFFLLGYTAPMIAYYLPDLLKVLGTTNITIMMRKITSVDLLASYDKNIMQLGFFFLSYVLALRVTFNQQESLKLAYLQRSKTNYRRYFYKIIASLVVTWLCLTLSYFSCIYVLWALDYHLVLSHILLAYGVMLLGFSSLICLTLVLAIYLDSALIAAFLLQLLLLVGSVLSASKIISKWTPWSLLTTAKIVQQGTEAIKITPIIICFSLCFLTFASVLFVKSVLKYNTEI